MSQKKKPSPKVDVEQENQLTALLRANGYQIVGMSRAYDLVALEVLDCNFGGRYVGVGATVLKALQRLKEKFSK
jgi:hypothetical protein